MFPVKYCDVGDLLCWQDNWFVWGRNGEPYHCTVVVAGTKPKRNAACLYYNRKTVTKQFGTCDFFVLISI